MSSTSEQDEQALPDRASVVVVGAGLSGLVAAFELVAAGVDDVVVVEARDRVGGRMKTHTAPNGRVLVAGGEFTGAVQVELQALAASLGVEPEARPATLFPELKSVRRNASGERFVEAFPLENDPDSMAEVTAAADRLTAMAGELSAAAPWEASRAREWDSQTLLQWFDTQDLSPNARGVMELLFAVYGDAHEVSLLFVLWCIARSGEPALAHGLDQRFVGGSTEVPIRLAAKLGDRVFMSRPVRRIDRSDDGVLVRYDGGTISASAVILALEPGQADKIEFVPPVPPARDHLQTHWLACHGAKVFAVYDSPFWREDGLNGLALGPGTFGFVTDASPGDGDEGILLSLFFESGSRAAEASDVLTDEERCREVALRQFADYFGDRALDAREFYLFDWSGDAWSRGCGTALPPGVLSTVGSTLREPLGRILWAGADTGDMDWMEGAVTSGRRAAGEACALLPS